MSQTFIFGASRGLGAALVRHLGAGKLPVHGFARKADRLGALAQDYSSFTWNAADLSRAEDQARVITQTLETDVRQIVCVLGGGPFGAYGERPFHAHQWAWAVTFEFQARLLHALAAAKRFVPTILVGSAVAERAADPGAASYAAAKHALVGLHATLRLEVPEWDLRLFSPGYIDTELLPALAKVREGGVYTVDAVAAALWDWAETPDIGGHRVYPKHPR